MSSREERLAENETRFRKANEALVRDWEKLEVTPDELTMFICECGDVNCREIMRMTLEEYEAVRADANTFAVVPGHDDAPTERVVTESIVDKNERFAIVRKHEEFRAATEGTDPR
jgi:hypothetical protein